MCEWLLRRRQHPPHAHVAAIPPKSSVLGSGTAVTLIVPYICCVVFATPLWAKLYVAYVPEGIGVKNSTARFDDPNVTPFQESRAM